MLLTKWIPSSSRGKATVSGLGLPGAASALTELREHACGWWVGHIAQGMTDTACYLPLVKFQSAEMVILNGPVQLRSYFMGIKFVSLPSVSCWKSCLCMTAELPYLEERGCLFAFLGQSLIMDQPRKKGVTSVTFPYMMALISRRYFSEENDFELVASSAQNNWDVGYNRGRELGGWALVMSA